MSKGENTGGGRVQEIRFGPQGWTDIGGLCKSGFRERPECQAKAFAFNLQEVRAQGLCVSSGRTVDR